MGTRGIRLGWLALTTLALGCSLARADTAVVVGVDKYANLEHADLEGCVNDANEVAAMLKRYGFDKVTLLTNEQATKQGVLDAIAEAKKQSPTERFVFYFAGHGDRTLDLASGVLLPSDTTADPGSPQITKGELSKAVGEVPASSRTVLLDSCFSGAMSRSLRKMPRKVRFYSRRGARHGDSLGSKDLVLANRRDVDPVIPNSICYFTASKDNEVAGEDDFDGQRHGIFTYFLTHKLDGAKTPWGTVQIDVAGQVETKSEGNQHPVLSPAFSDKEVFTGDPTEPKPTPNYSLWDQYNEEHPDASKVQLLVSPDKTTMLQGKDGVRFTIQPGFSGHLVVIEKGTSGNINLLWPLSGELKDASLDGNAAKSIPENAAQAWFPDAEGTEYVKAILFTSPVGAKALLDAFGARKSISQKRARDLVLGEVERKAFYTSTVSFQVVKEGSGSEIAGGTHERAERFALVAKAAARPSSGTFTVRVLPMRQVGGLPPSLKAAKPPLSTQIGAGFRNYLVRSSAQRFEVGDGTAKGVADRTLTLEGDLSCVTAIPGRPGPFLCVWRMFREGAPRTLVAQWAGSAKNYRDLTSNVSGDPLLTSQGLIGTLGQQMVEDIERVRRVDALDRFAAFVALAEQGSKISAVVRQNGEGVERLSPGAYFDVAVEGVDSGDAYVVGMLAGDSLQTLYVPIVKQTPRVGRVTLSGLRVPSAEGETKLSVYVFLRKLLVNDPRSATIDFSSDASPPGTPQMSVLSPLLSSRMIDPTVLKILDLAQGDPAKSWQVVRIDVPIRSS